MHIVGFFILLLCVALAGGFGIWAGSWLYHLTPLKNNAAYIVGFFILCPVVCIACLLSLVMPVIGFLAGIGRK
jgi:hypothetical protein